MSIAYLDPGNIESDLQSGSVAQFKVGMLENKECVLCGGKKVSGSGLGSYFKCLFKLSSG